MTWAESNSAASELVIPKPKVQARPPSLAFRLV
jgi:hypothetical protein